MFDEGYVMPRKFYLLKMVVWLYYTILEAAHRSAHWAHRWIRYQRHSSRWFDRSSQWCLFRGAMLAIDRSTKFEFHCKKGQMKWTKLPIMNQLEITHVAFGRISISKARSWTIWLMRLVMSSWSLIGNVVIILASPSITCSVAVKVFFSWAFAFLDVTITSRRSKNFSSLATFFSAIASTYSLPTDDAAVRRFFDERDVIDDAGVTDGACVDVVLLHVTEGVGDIDIGLNTLVDSSSSKRKSFRLRKMSSPWLLSCGCSMEVACVSSHFSASLLSPRSLPPRMFEIVSLQKKEKKYGSMEYGIWKFTCERSTARKKETTTIPNQPVSMSFLLPSQSS